MRMRRKKHLEERISNVKDFLIVAERDISNVKEAIKDKKIEEVNNLTEFAAGLLDGIGFGNIFYA